MKHIRMKKAISFLLMVVMMLSVAGICEASGEAEPQEAAGPSAVAEAPAAVEEVPAAALEEEAPAEQPDQPETAAEAAVDDPAPADEEAAEPDDAEKTSETEDAPESAAEAAASAAAELEAETEAVAEAKDDQPEKSISEAELSYYGEASYNFNFRVDTIWEEYDGALIMPVCNAATMIAAVNTINSLGNGVYYIALAADVTLPASGQALTFSCGEVTILGCGHTLQLQPMDGGESCLVIDGAEVSLGAGSIDDELTIRGFVPADEEEYASLITVLDGSLWLHDGTVIEDHTAGHGAGGAILVEGGTLWMLGGTIRNCGVTGRGAVYGGAVGVAWGGSFYMLDGEITGCFAESESGEGYGGGVAAFAAEDVEAEYEKAPVQLLGGSVTDCSADFGGGAALAAFPGAVILGSVSITDNEGGVWYSEAEGFALYVYGGCVIRDSEDEAICGDADCVRYGVLTDESTFYVEEGEEETPGAELGAAGDPIQR